MIKQPKTTQQALDDMNASLRAFFQELEASTIAFADHIRAILPIMKRTRWQRLKSWLQIHRFDIGVGAVVIGLFILLCLLSDFVEWVSIR